MRSAALRHLVALQSPTGSRDSVGGQVTSWTTEATVYASVEPLSGREAWLAAQTQAETTHKICLRYSSNLADLDASWRVLWGLRVFEIEARLNVAERNRELELRCVEREPLEADDETFYLLLESGDALLLESGDHLLLEEAA